MKRLLLVLLCLPVTAWADAYYSFDGTNDRMVGSFTSTYGDPMTIGFWLRYSDHPTVTDVIVTVGNASSSQNNSYICRFGATDNTFQATSNDSGGSISSATATKSADNTWIPMLCEYIADNSRAVFTSDQTATNATSRAVSDAIQFISFGENLAGGSDAEIDLAYVSIWDVQLSDPNEASFLGGSCPSGIDASNLIGYWDLQTNSGTQTNAGVDAGGDLTVTGATYNATGGPGVSCTTTPTFTAGPSAGTITSTTIPVTFTSDTTGTVKGTACTNGNAGNKTETLAGQCSGGGAAVATISEAVTATVGDGASFTGLSSGTTYDLGFVIDATTDSDLYSLADQTTDSGSPGFNEGIDCTGSDSDTYLCTYDANADADDIFLCVMKKDASAPANGAAVVACSGGIGTATEAATGSADSLSVDVTMTGGAPPIADIYSTASASGPTYSSVGSDLDVPLPAPTGRQYVTKSGAPGVGEEGILDDASPAAVDGDIMDAATHADSFNEGDAVHAITLNANTTFEIVADGDTSQHKFTRRFYDVSAAAWSDATAVLYCVNNTVASYVGPASWEGDTPFLFEKSVAAALSLDSIWEDPESDPLTHNILNLPAGFSEDGEDLSGTPTTFGYYPTVELQAFDDCGDQADVTVQFIVGVRLPDVLSWLQDESRWETHSLFASANDGSYYLPKYAIH